MFIAAHLQQQRAVGTPASYEHPLPNPANSKGFKRRDASTDASPPRINNRLCPRRGFEPGKKRHRPNRSGTAIFPDGHSKTPSAASPAGGTWGGRGESIIMDAFDFCRTVSGRGPDTGLLSQQVPF
jgi:hypothetical protein